MEILDNLNCLLRNLYAGKEETVTMGMEKQTASKLGKDYANAVYFHLTYLTRMRIEGELLSHVRLFATPWTVAYQDPPSMEFSR